MTGSPATPGSHAPGHGRNWQPAETFAEYLANCRAGLETYSDRRAAKLLGWSRMQIYRAKLMAEIPDELFDALLSSRDGKMPSAKELAAVAMALRGEGPAHDAEHCPHCGGLLRLRRRWKASTADIVNRWLRGRAP